jgi:hypothetical protein
MTRLEGTDLKLGNADSRVKSAPKGKQARISHMKYIAIVTSQPDSRQIQLIYELD